MKKALAILLIFTMCFVFMTGCGKDEGTTETDTEETTYHLDISPYDSYDYSEYVSLPDYTAMSFGTPEVNITDEDIDNEIQSRLDAASTETETITEGTVDKGDTVNISFKGTLEDGSSPENMNSDEYQLTLGAASMIDGFQEAMYGATIGEPIIAELQFPDPYEVDESLSGQPVTFEITVLSKEQVIEATYDEEFMKTDSDGEAKNEEDYRAFIKEYLEETEYEDQVYDIKTDFYYEILEQTEILQYPEDQVQAQLDALKEQYQSYAESMEMEWEEFVEQYFQDVETFDTQADEYVRDSIKNNLVIYALCDKEGLAVTDDEYTQRVNEYLTYFGADAATFESYYGVSIEEYCEIYGVGANMYLDKFLDTVYDKMNG